MQTLWEDIRFAWRNALKKPGTALLIVVTLALGIGANSAMFSMTWQVLLAPLPFADGERLLRLRQNEAGVGLEDTALSVRSYEDFRRQSTSFSELLEYHRMTFTLLGRGEPLLVQTGVSNWNFFELLGIHPLHGRGFRSGEDEIGAEPLILLSHDFWQRQFGGDAEVVGQLVEMNNAAHRIIGVLPPLPAFPDANDIWITWASCPYRANPTVIDDRSALTAVLGKLHEHVTLEEAGHEVHTIAQRLRAAYPDAYPEARGFDADVVPIREEMVGNSATTFVLLLGMAFLVVLVACANVANLNLARLMARNRELAIREAVGANPRRIARQLLTESLLFALLGAALGLLIAYPALDLLSAFALRFTPLGSEIEMNVSVLLFALVIALLTGLASGSAAAFNRRDINKALKEDGDKVTTSTAGKRRRQILLVLQFALSFVILTATGLVVLSLHRLNQEEAGYRSEQVVVANLQLNFSRYPGPEQQRDFAQRLLREAAALPGVESAGLSARTPLQNAALAPVAFDIEGRTLGDALAPPSASLNVVSEDYFRVLEVPLLKGRLFGAADDERGEGVALINRTLERNFFPNGDALGQRIRTPGSGSWRSIVGVVGDMRAEGLDQEAGNALYYDFRQRPVTVIDLFVRSSAEPRALASILTDLVHLLDAQQAVASVRSLEDIKSDWLAAPGLSAVLIGLFGLLALLVTLSGVVGVISFNVAQRMREIGIHMALGAHPGKVVGLFVRQGLGIYLPGLLTGLLIMLMGAGLLQPFLYETSAFDPGVYLLSGLLLSLTVLLAMYLPARQAGRLDPNQALHIA